MMLQKGKDRIKIPKKVHEIRRIILFSKEWGPYSLRCVPSIKETTYSKLEAEPKCFCLHGDYLIFETVAPRRLKMVILITELSTI